MPTAPRILLWCSDHSDLMVVASSDASESDKDSQPSEDQLVVNPANVCTTLATALPQLDPIFASHAHWTIRAAVKQQPLPLKLMSPFVGARQAGKPRLEKKPRIHDAAQLECLLN